MNSWVQTTICDTLPLLTGSGRDTAPEAYDDLVLVKRLVPARFFPFAVDSGGDFFFVDCEDKDAAVYLFQSDHFPRETGFASLELGLEDFWDALEPDEML